MKSFMLFMTIWLILGVVAYLGLFYMSKAPVRRPEKRGLFRNSDLLDIPEDQKMACMRWAVGDDFMSQPPSIIDDRWRSLHPDLPPIYGSTDVRVGFAIIGQEWIKQAGRIK